MIKLLILYVCACVIGYMSEILNEIKKKNYWLVDVHKKNEEDNIKRFVTQGVWVNSDYDKFSDLVKSEMQSDDLIAIKSSYTKEVSENNFVSVLKIMATGTIIRNFKDGRFLEVRWERNFESFELENIVKTDPVVKLTDLKDINSVFFPDENILEEKVTVPDFFEQKKETFEKHSLNTIFYGPSGSGKTFKAITTALEIIDGFYPLSVDEIRKKYNHYVKNGQIVFLTFHEKYSYEDFVENVVKTIDKETGEIRHEVRTGAFKEICNLASSEIFRINSRVKFNIEPEKSRFFKMSVGTISNEKDDHTLSYCYDNNYIALDMSGIVDFSIVENNPDWETAREDFLKIYFHDTEYEKKRTEIQSIYYFKNYMRSNDIIFVSNDNNHIIGIAKVNGWYEFKDIPGVKFHHFRKVEWLLKNCNIPCEKFYSRDFSDLNIYELDKKNMLMDNIIDFISTERVRKNYVVIIDEINLGDINKIFGEMISLLEPQKRIGASEELKVKLTYSNHEFGIPKNLYILGTMHSIHGDDIFDEKLRRRFDFVENEIDYDSISFKIDNIQIDKMLMMINRRIEYFLSGQNHLKVGHAYFTALKNNPSFEQLRIIFKTKIIPLLLYYFENDYEKVHLILGDNQKDDNNLRFIQLENVNSNSLFGNNYRKYSKKIYKLNIPNLPEGFMKIYD